MRIDDVVVLVDPKSKRPLKLKPGYRLERNRIREGGLFEPISGREFPVKNFIPRFVPEDNYAKSFGLEWNVHNRTQYDRESGTTLSEERFRKETAWGESLNGEVILEIGSGSGRFTREALKTEEERPTLRERSGHDERRD